MITRTIDLNGKSDYGRKTREIALLLKSGAIAAIPTETVFGLACSGANKEAVRRLYKLKRRPLDKPFVVQVDKIAKLLGYGISLDGKINRVLNRFWPGPLTVLLETSAGKTGFRMPDNKAALSIIAASDFPVFVTSANMSGKKELVSAEEVGNTFDGLIDIIVDDGTIAEGTASTVLDCTRSHFKILRHGALSRQLTRFLGYDK
ncbi:MAG: L-threonylcarbamoyladenylate synthase [Candidatus Omnitrophica bacterium]|jgi:L-threonylcarbamoyladenylate synthase|nr:L-threonylcarbamoyladenylate synthase [Candidatus Omnitrophota bacterium]